MSLNSVSKHIKVLERAGLVARRTEWREHLIEVQIEPLRGNRPLVCRSSFNLGAAT